MAAVAKTLFRASGREVQVKTLKTIAMFAVSACCFNFFSRHRASNERWIFLRTNLTQRQEHRPEPALSFEAPYDEPAPNRYD
jgi:hypothetical protein